MQIRFRILMGMILPKISGRVNIWCEGYLIEIRVAGGGQGILFASDWSGVGLTTDQFIVCPFRGTVRIGSSHIQVCLCWDIKWSRFLQKGKRDESLVKDLSFFEW